MTTRMFGERVPRREDGRFLTGRGRYTADFEPKAAHAAFVRSDFAHARILGVDTSAAASLPGVLGVFTADPRIVPEARKLDRVSFEEVLEMAASGAGVPRRSMRQSEVSGRRCLSWIASARPASPPPTITVSKRSIRCPSAGPGS